VSAALSPYVSGGVYLNFVGQEGDERIRAAYGDANLRRLQAVKERYDPDNVFRLNHNIRPVRAAALKL
jgi:FAD/FMN-containing dehydrogenase